MFPAPSDPTTESVLTRARDLLAANVLWGYVLEIARAGCPVTTRTIHDVAEAVRAGELPDRSLESIRGPFSLIHEPVLVTA